MTQNNGGFSLVEIMVSIVILLVTSLAVLYTLSSSALLQAQLRSRATLAQLDNFVDSAMKNQAMCDCQVSDPTNPNLTLDLNLPSPPDIELNSTTSPCSLVSGTEIFPSVVLESIKLVDLAKTGSPNLYTGFMELRLKNLEGSSIRPVRTFVPFEVDPATRRPIRCALGNPPASGLLSCPPGFTMLGAPGEKGNICIENSQRAPVIRPVALNTCNSLQPPGFNRARVCYSWEIRRACFNPGLTGSNDEEFSIEISVNGPTALPLRMNIRAPGCAPNWSSAPTNIPGAFRCCIQ